MRRFLTDPSRIGIWLLICLLTVVSLIALLWVDLARAETPSGVSAKQTAFQAASEQDAIEMTKHWVRLTPRHPLANEERRAKFAGHVVEATERHDTPLALVMAIVFRESSGRSSARGFRGHEIGLMQVHPHTAARFHCRHMDKPSGQLDCGNRILKHWADKCGSWRGGLTVYASRHTRCRARPGSNLAAVVADRFKLAAELEAVAR